MSVTPTTTPTPVTQAGPAAGATPPINHPQHRPATAGPARRLSAYRAGAGDALVLLHGFGESHIGWRPVIDALAAEYDVIAIDLPGFGRSPALPPQVSPTAGNLAAAVQDTLDDLGVGAYHVAGYSLGARVGIHLAGSDRVRSVIAISPDGLSAPPSGNEREATMKTVKEAGTVIPAVLLTAAAVLGIGVLIGLSSWSLM